MTTSLSFSTPRSRSSTPSSSTTRPTSPVPIGLALHTTLSNGSASTVRGGASGEGENGSPGTTNEFESPPRGATGTSGMSSLQRTTSAPPLSNSGGLGVGASASAGAGRLSTSPPTRGTPLPSTSNPGSRTNSRPRASTSATRQSQSQGTPLYSSPALLPTNRPSLSIPSRPNSTPSPSPSSGPSYLLTHLYTTGLLQSSLSDLHLVVFSTYYKLHKLVLGQSGFFKSLLSGGWTEESSTSFTTLKIEMAQPFTRTAFEYCLANLYGGDIKLVPPVWSRTTSNAPLGVGWERIWEKVVLGVRGGDTGGGVAYGEGEDVQEATPQFLLSLLATATYLEMPRVQAKALALIQSTITPWTLTTYLGFALGNGLGTVPSEYSLDQPLSGLESVGTPYAPPDSTTDATSPSPPSHSRGSRTSSQASHHDEHEHDEETTFVGPEGERVGQACSCWLSKWGAEILSIEEYLATATPDEKASLLDVGLPGLGFLSLLPPLKVWTGIPASWVRGIISSDAFFLGPSAVVGNVVRDDLDECLEKNMGGEGGQQSGNGEFERYLFARRVVELRRREKRRIKAELDQEKDQVVSVVVSDSRDPSVYEMAGEPPSTPQMGFDDGVIERFGDEDEWQDGEGDGKDGCWETRSRETGAELDEQDECEEDEEDEIEYDELFASGIHYSHMTFAQLTYISQDISPTTYLPYVPLSIVQGAFWSSTTFLNRIPVTPAPFSNVSHSIYSVNQVRMREQDGNVRDGDTVTPPGGTNSNGTELGLSAPIDAKLRERKNRQQLKTFYLVPVDDTSRLNDGPLPGSDIDPASTLTNHQALPASLSGNPPKVNKPPSMPLGPQSFFGLALETRQGVQNVVFGTEEEMALGRRFVEFEPLRFCAEFWGVEELRDKQRLYSQTFFYAGSYYNLYLQKIQKKGIQLGIYLHRQNQLETFPSASRPPPTSSTPPALLAQVASRPGATPAPTGPNAAPYVDKRKAIKAFFSIWCPNQLGTSMTRFSSGPDSFALSQSWGWKSSSLSSEYITQQTDKDVSQVGTIDPSEQLGGRFKGLRVALVMGIV